LRQGPAAEATDARICSYECIFCAECVEQILHNICPNCGGGFAPRPIRPASEWRPGVSRQKQLPSAKRVHLKWDPAELPALIQRVRGIRAEDR
jgi:uncharacterized protein